MCVVVLTSFSCKNILISPWRFSGEVRREFMQSLSADFHDTLGSYLRDALQEGNADAVAYLPIPRA
jgi:hypothetical protein